MKMGKEMKNKNVRNHVSHKEATSSYLGASITSKSAFLPTSIEPHFSEMPRAAAELIVAAAKASSMVILKLQQARCMTSGYKGEPMDHHLTMHRTGWSVSTKLFFLTNDKQYALGLKSLPRATGTPKITNNRTRNVLVYFSKCCFLLSLYLDIFSFV